MDFMTFFFAVTPPLLAIALAIFAGVSTAYVEREAKLSAQEFSKAKVKADIQDGIKDAIVRVSKGALLIANVIATLSSCIISIAVPLYFLPGNYFVAFGVIALIFIYAAWVLTKIATYGLKDVYVQRVHTRQTKTTGQTQSFTYGTLIDYGMIALNALLGLLVLGVYLYSRG
ncbi:hypothetical protein [Rhizobium indigoferae]|uniref:Uncharacterized protein n=1 Tax=Rhizobium indigoferae TaxID=158891 RepID=A0ABZ1DNU4_9HYPH|nr:hypothetical protein [Rhizobium indigoferae]NNU57026.1 hypothetical protein [Rhizobium indigoferae]WRW37686.1 hypothetical protein U5G49_007297 [Rhizobium indigoferae]GLR60311.1 hypothetical protein GCM10007919_50390 [Rhizobium indigoferae]